MHPWERRAPGSGRTLVVKPEICGCANSNQISGSIIAAFKPRFLCKYIISAALIQLPFLFFFHARCSYSNLCEGSTPEGLQINFWWGGGGSTRLILQT